MTPLTQVIQPATGRDRIRSQACPSPKPGSDHNPQSPFGTLLISILALGTRHRGVYPILQMRQLRPEVITTHLAFWALFLGREKLSSGISALPSALCPMMEQEGPDVCRTKCQAREGSLAPGPRPPSTALLDGFSRSPPQAWGPGLLPPPCSVL